MNGLKTRSFVAPWAPLLGACWLLGCSALIDTEVVQCERDEDCQAVGSDLVCGEQNVCVTPASPAGELPSELACQDRSLPRAIESRTVTVRFTLFNYGSLTIPMGVEVKACERFDGSCASPVVEDVTVDDEGYVELVLPHGFSGYFELSGEGFVPSLLFRNLPLVEDETFEGPALVTPAIRDGLAQTGNESIDTELGIAIVDVRDCERNPIAGVAIEQAGREVEESPFYFVDALPDRMLSATQLSPRLTLGGTDRSVAGFSMVPPGNTEIVARHRDSGERVGSVVVTVRPGTLSYAMLLAGY